MYDCEKASDISLEEIARALSEYKRVILAHYSSFVVNTSINLIAEKYYIDKSFVVKLKDDTLEEELSNLEGLRDIIQKAKTNKTENYLIAIQNLTISFLSSVARNKGYRFFKRISKQGIPGNVFVLAAYEYDSAEGLMEIGMSGVSKVVINYEGLYRKHLLAMTKEDKGSQVSPSGEI